MQNQIQNRGIHNTIKALHLEITRRTQVFFFSYNIS